MNIWKTGCVVAVVAAAGLGGMGAPLAIAQQQQAPERSLSEIDWPDAEADAIRDGTEPILPGRADARRLQFSARQLQDASDLTIPLLMPRSLLESNRRNQLDEPLSLESALNDYSAEAKLAPRSYLVQGTRVVFETASAVPADPVPADVYVEKTLYGVEATFERYGAVYSITIFCADPEGDPECAEEARVRGLVSDMTLATQTR